MTIYLHYRALQQICDIQQGHVSNDLYHRQIIREYRQQILEAVSPHFTIVKNHYGKPLSKYDAQFSFNHSHSQQYYALVYRFDGIDLGVDIEDLSRNVKMFALAKRIFHPKEYQIWQDLDYCREFWFKVWTIKEAVLKAHSMGIRLQLNSLNTQAHPTWDFGRVEHKLLGTFTYQCIRLPKSILTIAYQSHDLHTIFIKN